jgi:hypothetical protein
MRDNSRSTSCTRISIISDSVGIVIVAVCHGSGHELEYNVLNRVVIKEGYVRVTMRV